jgi:DNA processing protein
MQLKEGHTDKLRVAALVASKLPAEVRRLLQEQISSCPDNDEEILGRLPQSVSSLLGDPSASASEKLIEEWCSSGGEIVTLWDEGYPGRLAAIPDPPLLLFYRGGPIGHLSEKPCVAVVGSRNADTESCRFAASLSTDLAASGACVVSGLALGIDGAAHEGALRPQTHLPTVAVLGNGLRKVYPAHHERLADKILVAGGILISEFAPDEKPYPANFLKRNRIISGLCDAVVVVQAAKRSGALVTARFALEQGREVCASPGRPDDIRFAGSNQLIKDGASLVTGIEDLRELFPQLTSPITEAVNLARANAFSGAKAVLVRELENRAKLSVTELEELTPAPFDLAQDLLELELMGVVQRLPGNIIALQPGSGI